MGNLIYFNRDGIVENPNMFINPVPVEYHKNRKMTVCYFEGHVFNKLSVGVDSATIGFQYCVFNQELIKLIPRDDATDDTDNDEISMLCE